MKQIRLEKNKDLQIGGVRVTKEIYDKIQKLAKENDVSPQTIIRVILENFIDEITIIQ